MSLLALLTAALALALRLQSGTLEMQWSALRAEPGVVARSGTNEIAADFSQALPVSWQNDALLRWAVQSAGSALGSDTRSCISPRNGI